MRFKNIIFILIISIFIAGCTPYFMLDEKGKVQRIIEKYVTLINKQNFEEAFKFITFIHQPSKKNFEMFSLAQKLMTSQYEDIEYIVKDVYIKDKISTVSIDMILGTSRFVKRKLKIQSQMYLYKPENSVIWFIVPGDINSRRVFYEKFKDKIDSKYIPKEDNTFIFFKDKWIDMKNTKNEEGKLFIQDDGKWIEYK